MARTSGQFGPFELVRSIGEGANGEVWEARRPHTEQPTAVKILTGSSTVARARFFRECRVKLDHPHIVTVLEHGEADGAPWLEMELLRGETLQSRLGSRSIRLPDAIEIARQVGSALEHAHARGITHRDLKPENMMLLAGSNLHVKVLDFGLARIFSEAGVTRTGTAVGTALYMSPEQVQGIHGVDMRSDVWSLGVMLYELLTGVSPFRAENIVGTLYNILQQEPPTLPSALSPELCALVVAMLDKDPTRRPDATRVVTTLEQVPTPNFSRLPNPIDLSLEPTIDSGDDGLLPVNFNPALLHDQRTQSVLISVVFFRKTRDPRPVSALAEKLGARVCPLLRDNLLVLLGQVQWKGDEPERAVRLAAALWGSAEAVGVATGRVLRYEENLVGMVAHIAASIAQEPGVTVDATTATLLRGRFSWAVKKDGCARLELSAPARSPAQSASSAPFFGRDSERNQLVDLVREARDSCALSGMLITGTIGMGKSLLRWAAQQRLQQQIPEAIVLVVRCDPLRAHSPFSAIRESLSGAIDDLLLAHLDPSPSASSDPQSTLDRIRGTLEIALRDLSSRGPLVLAIDDAQWLDAASAASLRWLVQNVTDLPLTLWLFSTPEASATLSSVLPTANVRQLDVLSEALSRKVLQHYAPAAPPALLERAGGHPLFLEELGRLYAETGAMPEQLPPTLAVALHAALDRLLPAQREFLKRAALFGRTAWVEGVEAIGAERQALESLVAARILVHRKPSRFERCQQFAFRSGAPQEAAIKLWPEAQRKSLQTAAGEWLAERPEVTQAELGEFWEQAGELRRAAVHLVAAAQTSARVADTATTLSLTDKVLTWLDNFEELPSDLALQWNLLIARDDALQLSSQLELQLQGLNRLDALSARMPIAAALELSTRESYACRMQHDLVGAEAHGLEAVALAEAIGDQRGAAMAHSELAMCCTDQNRFALAEHHAREGLAAAERAGDPWLKAKTFGARGYGIIEQGRIGEALDWFTRAADLYKEAGDLRREALVLNNTAVALMRLGRLAEAQERLELTVARSAKVGNQRTQAVAAHNLAILLRMLGDTAAATKISDEIEPRALSMKHRLLEAEIVIEKVYQALARAITQEQLHGLPELLLRIQSLLNDVQIPSLASGLVLAWSCANSALGSSSEDCRKAVQRAFLITASSLESRAILAVAQYLSEGMSPEAAQNARELIQDFAHNAALPAEVMACRSAFTLRWRVPPEVCAP